MPPLHRLRSRQKSKRGIGTFPPPSYSSILFQAPPLRSSLLPDHPFLFTHLFEVFIYHLLYYQGKNRKASFIQSSCPRPGWFSGQSPSQASLLYTWKISISHQSCVQCFSLGHFFFKRPFFLRLKSKKKVKKWLHGKYVLLYHLHLITLPVQRHLPYGKGTNMPLPQGAFSFPKQC